MAAITTPVGFDVQGPTPLELKTVVNTDAERLAIPLVNRYEGLRVYVKDTKANWQLQGGTDDVNWTQDTADLTAYLRKDGTVAMEADFNAGGFRVTNAADGVASSDLVTVNQLSGYVPAGGTAADSDALNGQPASYYLDAGNLTGTLPNTVLNTTITSDTTGNAATATKLASEFELRITGDATGSVLIDGSEPIEYLSIVIPDKTTNWEPVIIKSGWHTQPTGNISEVKVMKINDNLAYIKGSVFTDSGTAENPLSLITLPSGFEPIGDISIYKVFDGVSNSYWDFSIQSSSRTITPKRDGVIVDINQVSFNFLFPLK